MDDYYDFGSCWTTDCWDAAPLPFQDCDLGIDDGGWFGTDLSWDQLVEADPSVLGPAVDTALDDLGVLYDTAESVVESLPDVDVTEAVAPELADLDDMVTTAAPDLDDAMERVSTAVDDLDVDDVVTMAAPDLPGDLAEALPTDLPDIADDLVPQDFAVQTIELSDIPEEGLADAAGDALQDALGSFSASLADPDAEDAVVDTIGAIDEPAHDEPMFASDDDAEPSYSGNAFPPDETLDQP
jgi:hypothetical protein